MANTFRLKRRVTGSAGAPTSLKSGEISYNMVDGKFYVGFGDDGSGNATSIKIFAQDNYIDPSTLYQPKDADLDAIAALAATGGMLARTGANAFAVRTIAGNAGRTTVTNGDGVAGAPTVDLATVSVGGTVTGNLGKFNVDAYGRVTAAAQSTLTDVAAPTASFSFNGQRLTSLADPTTGSDAATKNYVDTVAQGIDDKDSVRVATTANITLSGTQTIDGVAVIAGDRVLVKNQTTAADNGIYVVAAGAWTRAIDADTWNELLGARVVIEEGAANQDQLWIATANRGGTIGTTAVTWSQVGGTIGAFNIAGNGLTSTGTQIDVAPGAGITVAADTVALTGQALAIHNVTTAADQVIYATGVSTFAATALTSYGRSLIGAAAASNARTTLGLGTMAIQDASAVNITGGTIDGITLDGGTF